MPSRILKLYRHRCHVCHCGASDGGIFHEVNLQCWQLHYSGAAVAAELGRLGAAELGGCGAAELGCCGAANPGGCGAAELGGCGAAELGGCGVAELGSCRGSGSRVSLLLSYII